MASCRYISQLFRFNLAKTFPGYIPLNSVPLGAIACRHRCANYNLTVDKSISGAPESIIESFVERIGRIIHACYILVAICQWQEATKLPLKHDARISNRTASFLERALLLQLFR